MQATKEPETSGAEYLPKPLTARQNVIMTLKVLAGAAILIVLLWVSKGWLGGQP